MKTPRALVLTGNGTNCEREMAHGCRLAGAEAVIAHVSRVFNGEIRLADFHFLNLPGGFLDGDDLGSAKAAAVRFKYGVVQGDGQRRFVDDLMQFIDDGKLVLGVCNGFQLLVKMGLLPGAGDVRLAAEASLMHNDSGRFEDRWVHLKVDPMSPCVFTSGIDRLYVPVRHGEGKFVPRDAGVSDSIRRLNLAVVRYTDPEGRVTQDYPWNPNGSPEGIAGVCDPTGRVFGLMPHPEAFLHRTNHPRWTREDLPDEGQGLAIFRNAVKYLQNRFA